MIILRPQKRNNRAFKKSFRKIKKILPVIMGLAMLGVVFYFAFLSSLFKVTDVEIKGNKDISLDDLRSEINSKLNSKVIFFLPFDNYFVFSIGGLNKKLTEKFDRIESININKEFPDKLKIELTEKRGAFRWCRVAGCFLVNEDGLAYNIPLDESKLTDEEKKLVKFQESIHDLPANDEKVVKDDFIKSIWQIIDSLKQDLDVNILEFSTPNSFSGQVFAKTNEGWQIFFNTDLPALDQVKFIKVLFLDEISPEQKKELEYIDLRVGGRAYYKFKTIELKEEILGENPEAVDEEKEIVIDEE